MTDVFTFPNSFWHNNHTIFDVDIHYKGECIAMVSFYKKKQNWWPQDCTFWDDLTPTLTDNETVFLSKAKKRKELMTHLMEKAKTIYNQELKST